MSDNLLKLFRQKGRELEQFEKCLQDEISQFNEIAKALEDSQTLRRMHCRLIFSCIESYISHLKQSALLFSIDTPELFSREEKLALEEKEYFINDKGEVKTRNAKIGLRSNIRLAFRAAAKSVGEEYYIEFSDKPAQDFLKAIEIRNNITHPKNTANLTISDEDHAIVKNAWVWFGEHLVRIFKETPPTKEANS